MNKFLKDTLERGQGEQRARFINEMSEVEKAEFAKALQSLYEQNGLDEDDLFRSIPEAQLYL